MLQWEDRLDILPEPKRKRIKQLEAYLLLHIAVASFGLVTFSTSYLSQYAVVHRFTTHNFSNWQLGWRPRGMRTTESNPFCLTAQAMVYVVRVNLLEPER